MILQETEIRKPDEKVNPETQILERLKIPIGIGTVNSANPDLSYDKVIHNYFVPPVRPDGISDAAWKEMQSQGSDVISNEQAIVDNSVQAQRIAEAVSQRELITAAYSGSDAMASVAHATNLTNVINSGVPSGAASEIASQVARAADAAQAAAKASNDPDDIKAASVANILSAQATAAAAKVKESEVRVVQSETENTLLSLIDKAKVTGTLEDKTAVTLAQQRLTDANNNLMTAQSLSADASQYADMIKKQADLDAATIANELLKASEVIKPVEAAVKKSFLDKIVDYIYNKIY